MQQNRIWPILGLIGALTLAGPTQARQANGVRCVQEQLNAAGFDAGLVDGQIGRRSRVAFEAFAAQAGLEQGRGLTPGSATALCRRIGLHSPDLRAFWPSNQTRLLVTAAPGVPPAIASFVQTAAPGILSDVAARLGVELAGTTQLVLATTPRDLARMIRERIDYTITDLDASLRDRCNSFRNISGSAAPGIVYLCVNPTTDLGNGIAEDWATFTLAHEFTHIVQFDVGGVLDPGASPRDIVAAEGPVWLQEGMAQVIANLVSTPADEAHYRNVMVERLERVLPDLALLEDRSALERDLPAVYRAGAIAVVDLVEKSGWRPMGALFESLGAGMTWQDAFEIHFGTSVSDFYADFRSRSRP